MGEELLLVVAKVVEIQCEGLGFESNEPVDLPFSVVEQLLKSIVD
jgi:hypothetical protein